MATGGERQPHDRITGFEQRDEDSLVGLGARMRLHIGEWATEELLGPLDRKYFGDIDERASAIISATGIALGVFIGHHRALSFQHRPRDDVLTGDKFDL